MTPWQNSLPAHHPAALHCLTHSSPLLPPLSPCLPCLLTWITSVLRSQPEVTSFSQGWASWQWQQHWFNCMLMLKNIVLFFSHKLCTVSPSVPTATRRTTSWFESWAEGSTVKCSRPSTSPTMRRWWSRSWRWAVGSFELNAECPCWVWFGALHWKWSKIVISVDCIKNEILVWYAQFNIFGFMVGLNKKFEDVTMDFRKLGCHFSRYFMFFCSVFFCLR